jgi:hypothetical protein
MVKKLHLKASVGRIRNRKGVQPFEAGYIESVKSSFKGILDNMQQFVDWVPQTTSEILYDALIPTFNKSQVYTPVDTGDLKRSGFLEQEATKNGARVVIGYGRAGNPNYAAFVHERVDIPHAAPTRSRFLAAALEEDQGDIQNRIIQGYKQALP